MHGDAKWLLTLTKNNRVLGLPTGDTMYEVWEVWLSLFCMLQGLIGRRPSLNSSPAHSSSWMHRFFYWYKQKVYVWDIYCRLKYKFTYSGYCCQVCCAKLMLIVKDVNFNVFERDLLSFWIICNCVSMIIPKFNAHFLFGCLVLQDEIPSLPVRPTSECIYLYAKYDVNEASVTKVFMANGGLNTSLKGGTWKWLKSTSSCHEGYNLLWDHWLLRMANPFKSVRNDCSLIWKAVWAYCWIRWEDIFSSYRERNCALGNQLFTFGCLYKIFVVGGNRENRSLSIKVREYFQG